MCWRGWIRCGYRQGDLEKHLLTINLGTCPTSNFIFLKQHPIFLQIHPKPLAQPPRGLLLRYSPRPLPGLRLMLVPPLGTAEMLLNVLGSDAWG